ncbi:chaperone TorD involved in molybdoenzyme TorA maturation [Marinospirillum celere]|uniref:Chaperone TorD involved in molybdoenzyme TorA maturation n=1 Tax=Marinospirillum celere TaxID=1122252 RepID=A0A1I1HW26_9GAMM|nr:molecular chaperone TorD family protein [Marinospirillum celere]SFC28134.1 chaperone TorD involved in molybdoenzyme TorA maturation [Marinospirillum celere]
MQQEENALRADIYALLAALLRDAPSDELLEFLRELEIDPTQKNELQLGWKMLQMAAQKANHASVAEEYLPLFIGIGQGEITPFASWYLTGSIMEAPLIELRNDLKLLGFARSEEHKEPEDHIAALCEIMSLLIQQGASDSRQATFFHRHLAPWAENLCEDIQQASSALFYQAVATLALAFFKRERLVLKQEAEAAEAAVQVFSPAH